MLCRGQLSHIFRLFHENGVNHLRSPLSFSILSTDGSDVNFPEPFLIKQSMIIEFLETCNLVDSRAMPQLWFLQPKEYLSPCAFVSCRQWNSRLLRTPMYKSTERARNHGGNWTPILSPSSRTLPKGKYSRTIRPIGTSMCAVHQNLSD